MPMTGAVRAAGPPLAIRDLVVAFAERGGSSRVVLEVPALNIRGGAQIALCGPSGSGKTTLLNLLAGLRRPQRGTVAWGTVDLSTMSQRALERWRRESAGLVFQQFHLFPRLSAQENVLLPLRFDSWALAPDAKRRGAELLERVGVRAQGDLRTLSRGELQRVAVARALLRAPAIVLADEPTASLDGETGRALADLLCSLCREAGTTLVVATHDRALADRLDEVHEVVACRLQPQAGQHLAGGMNAFA
jgi:putative ABC transport system ATP-binding protein